LEKLWFSYFNVQPSHFFIKKCDIIKFTTFSDLVIKIFSKASVLSLITFALDFTNYDDEYKKFIIKF
jgi:hypothetical protein